MRSFFVYETHHFGVTNILRVVTTLEYQLVTILCNTCNFILLFMLY